MDNIRVEKLKQKIIAHIENGGSIYDKKDKLPYYEYMRDIKRDLSKELGRDVSLEEVYLLCGVNFNREYHNLVEEYKKFISFFEKVKGFANKDGYVDAMRKNDVRKIDNTYEQLKNYADKYACAPFDFLVLMTGFKLKKAYIPIDYVSYLSQKLKKEYPNGNIEGIRWKNPKLYEMIRHLRKYLPEQLSMQEVAEFLGVYNLRFGKKTILTTTNKKDVIAKLLEIFPDRNVSQLRNIDVSLYYQVIELSRLEDKMPYQWLNDNHFNTNLNMNTSRLSKASIDTEKRADFLLELREKYLEKFDLEKVDDIERFKIAIDMLKAVIKTIDSEEYSNVGIEEIIEQEENLPEKQNI